MILRNSREVVRPVLGDDATGGADASAVHDNPQRRSRCRLIDRAPDLILVGDVSLDQRDTVDGRRLLDGIGQVEAEDARTASGQAPERSRLRAPMPLRSRPPRSR